MNYELLKYTVQLDEYGDRSKTVAMSKSKPALAEYCQTKYGKPPVDTRPRGFDDYYIIVESKIEIVIPTKRYLETFVAKNGSAPARQMMVIGGADPISAAEMIGYLDQTSQDSWVVVDVDGYYWELKFEYWEKK